MNLFVGVMIPTEDLGDNRPSNFCVRFTIYLAYAFSIPASVLALIGSRWEHSAAVAYIDGLQHLGSNGACVDITIFSSSRYGWATNTHLDNVSIQSAN